jgi:RNase P subunit RPR2
MKRDPGNIAFCKHCRASWLVRESDVLVKILNRRDEDGKEYFMCRECGHETTVIMEKGCDFTEMDYEKYLVFSLTKAA